MAIAVRTTKVTTIEMTWRAIVGLRELMPSAFVLLPPAAIIASVVAPVPPRNVTAVDESGASFSKQRRVSYRDEATPVAIHNSAGS